MPQTNLTAPQAFSHSWETVRTRCCWGVSPSRNPIEILAVPLASRGHTWSDMMIIFRNLKLSNWLLGRVPELRESDRKQVLKRGDVLPTSGSLEVKRWESIVSCQLDCGYYIYIIGIFINRATCSSSEQWSGLCKSGYCIPLGETPLCHRAFKAVRSGRSRGQLAVD